MIVNSSRPAREHLRGKQFQPAQILHRALQQFIPKTPHLARGSFSQNCQGLPSSGNGPWGHSLPRVWDVWPRGLSWAVLAGLRYNTTIDERRYSPRAHLDDGRVAPRGLVLPAGQELCHTLPFHVLVSVEQEMFSPASRASSHWIHPAGFLPAGLMWSGTELPARGSCWVPKQ